MAQSGVSHQPGGATDDSLRRATAIRLVAFDVDGVLTNGALILGADGQEFKVFHVHDGLGLVMLRESGVHVAVISARESRVVEERMAALGITHICQGRADKGAALSKLMRDLNVTPAQTAYVGDDLVDLPALALAGLAIAVADAHPVVRERAAWVTENPGGRGAVREVCELILRAQGALDSCYRRYLAP